MTAYQVRYWFDSSSRDKTGEQVSEIIESEGPQAVVKRVQDFLAQSSFVLTPSFGPAVSGFIVIHTAQVRYVEIFPAPTAGASPTGYATTTMVLP